MNIRHGLSKKTSLYPIWCAMRNRCLNHRNRYYHNYGGRGIGICERWEKDFMNFYDDMGEPPPGMSIDRIDNDRGYCPENCKWSTRTEQMRNTRLNRMVSAFGETLCIADWAKKAGVNVTTIRSRLQAGQVPEEALLPPRVQIVNRVHVRKPSEMIVTSGGKSMTLKDWATETGIPVHCLIRRLDSGWCVSEALCKGRRGPRILTCNGQSRTITEWARHLGISREILYVRISKGMVHGKGSIGR